MEINILMGLGLVLSVGINGVLFRLASWQARDLTTVSDNIGDLVEILENYRNHLKKVYELDAFYGDETLSFLLEHTNAVRTILEEQYGEVASITEPIEYEIQEEEDGEETSEEKQKHVLYAGTRRRDN